LRTLNKETLKKEGEAIIRIGRATPKKRREQAVSLIFIPHKGHKTLSVKTYWFVIYLIILLLAISMGISAFFVANFRAYRSKAYEVNQAKQQNRERNEMVASFKKEAEALRSEVTRLLRDDAELKTKANVNPFPAEKVTLPERKTTAPQPAPTKTPLPTPAKEEESIEITSNSPSVKPVNGEVVYRFGTNRTLSNGQTISQSGTTFTASEDEPVVATGDGVVEMVGYGSLYGNQVLINHGKGYKSFYGHLSKTAIASGDSVKKGDVIGYAGDTGRLAEGASLFYQVFYNRQPVDPEKYF
jgi:murein DD-endopeptidase MepM/ murein hydrolase activator NlpD